VRSRKEVGHNKHNIIAPMILPFYAEAFNYTISYDVLQIIQNLLGSELVQIEQTITDRLNDNEGTLCTTY
jgi:hypothetical protein